MLHILFPAHCFHCRERLEKLRGQLCESCREYLLLLPVDGLSKKGESTFKSASCFEAVGPAVSLLRELQRKKRTLLARDLAAFLAIQLQRLQWPWPDFIVPVQEGENFYFNQLFAQALSKWIGCPSKKERRFSKKDLENRTLLLIEDAYEKLPSFVEKLQKRAAATTAIYGLTFLTPISD